MSNCGGLLVFQGRSCAILATCILIVVVVGECAIVRAATINVPADQPTIEDGILAASSGDVVLVAPGTYSERIALGDPPIKLVSANGPAVTTITGNGVGPVVNISGMSTIAGFTITGGVSASELSEGGGHHSPIGLAHHLRQHHYWELRALWRRRYRR